MTADMTAAQLVELLRDGAARGLTLAAARTQAVAVPLAPIEYGDLRDSLTLIPATPDDLEAAVVSDLPYAVRQHEDLHLQHPKGGQAKYLETAAHRTEQDAAQIVATAVRRRLGA